jgi:hypothetical protein
MRLENGAPELDVRACFGFRGGFLCLFFSIQPIARLQSAASFLVNVIAENFKRKVSILNAVIVKLLGRKKIVPTGIDIEFEQALRCRPRPVWLSGHRDFGNNICFQKLQIMLRCSIVSLGLLIAASPGALSCMSSKRTLQTFGLVPKASTKRAWLVFVFVLC